MQEFNRRKTHHTFMYSPFFLCILFVILLLLLKAVWGVYVKERTSAQYLEQEELELARAMTREEELRQSVDYLKTEKGIEAEIRSKFRVVKEGESVAVIVDSEPPPSAATSTPPTPWEKFLGFFGF